MSGLPEPEDSSRDFPAKELVDIIAAALPPNLQAAYYRELMHCRSLPDDDEMLRIIYILQILTYLIHEAPAMIMAERKCIEALFGSITEAIEKAVLSIREYRGHFDARLAALPEDVANRIQPERIAAAICEGVRQEFVRTSLPEMTQGFQATCARLEKVVTRLESILGSLEAAENRAVERIVEGSKRVLAAMHEASASISAEAERICGETSWQRNVLASIVIVITFLLGMKFDRWIYAPPSQPVEQAISPVTQPPPPAVHPKQRKTH